MEWEVNLNCIKKVAIGKFEKIKHNTYIFVFSDKYYVENDTFVIIGYSGNFHIHKLIEFENEYYCICKSDNFKLNNNVNIIKYNMGYFTRFKLKTNLTQDELNAMHKISNYAHSLEGLDFEAKWYDHEEEMLELSKLFPTKEFVLHGIGEERIDDWVKVFKNGNMGVSRCKYIHPSIEEARRDM